MSKYTVVGDPHAKTTNLDLISKLFSIVEIAGNDVIWLGDLLDTKEVIRGSCLNAYLRYFQSSKLQHYILVGNHDYFNLECKDHSLEALKLLENVRVIDFPTSFDSILFLPYIHGGENVRTALKNASVAAKVSHPILVGHLEVTGFDFGNGHICESGTSLEDLEAFKLVISGHFHKYQKKGNLVYLGTPFSHSFGESNQKKRLAILDTETATLEMFPLNFPQHITLELDVTDPAKAEEAFQKLLETKGHSTDHVRAILSGPSEALGLFNKARFEGVKFLEKPDEIEEGSVKIDESASNEQKFLMWAEGKNLSEETTRLGLELLKGSN